MTSILDELKAEEEKLRGIKAPRGEGQGYNNNPKALKRRIEDAKARVAKKEPDYG